tara:strand:+ start:1734 stop:2354 length:621 start_codon:yes stop_codon:yes gene_type:complete
MAKSLVFNLHSKQYEFEPLKLERKKLYGWSETIALNNEDEQCITHSLLPEFSMILPSGSTALGNLDESGNWVTKDQLKHVDAEGNAVEIVPSSFSEPVELNDKVSVETLLEHNISSIYSLQGEENNPDFVKEIQNEEQIYSFIFNYRADYEGDPAFVIENGGEIFILVGKKIQFEFIGLDDTGELDNDTVDSDEQDDGDDFDFSMM